MRTSLFFATAMTAGGGIGLECKCSLRLLQQLPVHQISGLGQRHDSLFTTLHLRPTFVYAVDKLSLDDVEATQKLNNIAMPSSYTCSVLKAAWRL
jgi:hypothetical protein